MFFGSEMFGWVCVRTKGGRSGVFRGSVPSYISEKAGHGDLYSGFVYPLPRQPATYL